MTFKFGEFTTKINISQELPKLNIPNSLIICDENTKQYAEKLCASAPLCVIKSGEENKTWDTVLQILRNAKSAGLGRDGVFVGVGGGVIGDLTSFAASIYMRGCRLQLVATTLLAMVDASVGGKTGFDLFDIKNLAGSFYPAEIVYMPMETLKTLPEKEYKSGLAELIKTKILSGSNLCALAHPSVSEVKLAVNFKGKIVSSDFKETKNKRALLNLGHTFGHALEAAAGLGNITHGDAVAWGIVQACNLGTALNITPSNRALQIKNFISGLGYDCSTPHPLAKTEAFKNAMLSDKKNKNKALTFIVPNKKSAQIVKLTEDKKKILDRVLLGEYNG